MNRVCLLKSTGKLIEMQGGGYEDEKLRDARLDTLKQNALNAGYTEDEIEVKWVTDAEWAAIQEANRPVPTAEQLKEAAIQEEMRRIAEASLIAKGELTAVK